MGWPCLGRRSTRPAQGVRLYLAMLGYTELLAKEAEGKLAQIVQRGMQVEQRAAELQDILGREPSDAHLAADLGYRNAAHVRLTLVGPSAVSFS
jgi:hypothetical protein